MATTRKKDYKKTASSALEHIVVVFSTHLINQSVLAVLSLIYVARRLRESWPFRHIEKRVIFFDWFFGRDFFYRKLAKRIIFGVVTFVVLSPKFSYFVCYAPFKMHFLVQHGYDCCIISHRFFVSYFILITMCFLNIINGFLSVEINVKVTDSQLDFSVSNTMLKENQQKNSSGIGLENIQKRLELNYPENYKLVNKTENNRYVVRLSIFNLNAIQNA